jgi:hypothetical protein
MGFKYRLWKLDSRKRIERIDLGTACSKLRSKAVVRSESGEGEGDFLRVHIIEQVVEVVIAGFYGSEMQYANWF